MRALAGQCGGGPPAGGTTAMRSRADRGHPAGTAPPARRPARGRRHRSGSFHKIISPDLLVIEPSGPVRPAAGQAGRGSPGCASLVSADGAAIRLDGHAGERARRGPRAVPVLDAAGHRVGSAAVDRARAGPLRGLGHAGQAAEAAPGPAYRLGGRGPLDLIDGGCAPLGIAGIDALVSSRASAGLGLVPGVLALISAPSVSIGTLTNEVRRITGQARTAHQPAAAAAAASGGPRRRQRPPGQLPPALPGLRGPVLPRPVLDRAGRHRPDRER